MDYFRSDGSNVTKKMHKTAGGASLNRVGLSPHQSRTAFGKHGSIVFTCRGREMQGEGKTGARPSYVRLFRGGRRQFHDPLALHPGGGAPHHR